LTENTEKEITEEISQKYEDIDICCKDNDKSLAKQSSTVLDSVSSDSQTASSSCKFSYFYQGK